MNLIELKNHLSLMMIDINSQMTDEEKMEYFNTEIDSFLKQLVDKLILNDYHIICDSSNQIDDDKVHANIAVKYPNQNNFYYISLKI